MAVAGVFFQDVPPPLPPPKTIDAELGWRWANSDSLQTPKRSAPVKPGSSLYGGGYRQTAVDEGDTSDQETEVTSTMDTSEYTSRRDSGISNLYSPTQAERQLKGSFANLFTRRSPSPSISQQRLHGESMRAQENITQSSQAYDRGMLLRIGKPPSPQRQRRPSPLEGSNTVGQYISFHTKSSRPPQFPPRDHDTRGNGPPAQRAISPPSTGASPASRSEWLEHNLNSTIPPGDGTFQPTSLGQDDFGSRTRPAARDSAVRSNFTIYNHIGTTDYTRLAGHDRSTSSEFDKEIFKSETGELHYLLIGTKEVQQTSPKQGMKRRAPSPPTEDFRGDEPGSSGEPRPKSLAPKHTWSSSPRHGSNQQLSPSSGTSSAHQSSYTSSLALSLAGSSLTTTSSGGERKSPPTSLQRLSSLTNPRSMDASLSAGIPPRNQPPSVSQTHTQDDRRASARSGVGSMSSSSQPNRIGNYFICSCCPKKPKKFDTEEDLQAHQMEKQYTCQYCNNRFKNKNEAERHQNSLHLRRHSWSCAAIPSFQAAFYNTSSPKPQSPTDTTGSDVCGFCGEEFPNNPTPDWEKRVEHLLNVHKFGECNQTKKFYRADHFRQHLKHSHAGQSGKWTNILEQVCLRDEGPDNAVTPNVGVSPAETSPSGMATISNLTSREESGVSPNFSERSLPSAAMEGLEPNERQRSNQTDEIRRRGSGFGFQPVSSERRLSSGPMGGQQHHQQPHSTSENITRRASAALSEILISESADDTMTVKPEHQTRPTTGMIPTHAFQSTSTSTSTTADPGRALRDTYVTGTSPGSGSVYVSRHGRMSDDIEEMTRR